MYTITKILAYLIYCIYYLIIFLYELHRGGNLFT